MIFWLMLPNPILLNVSQHDLMFLYEFSSMINSEQTLILVFFSIGLFLSYFFLDYFLLLNYIV